MKAGGLSWRIEETCFNAFPSLKQVLLGDWLLRFSAGSMRSSWAKRRSIRRCGFCQRPRPNG